LYKISAVLVNKNLFIILGGYVSKNFNMKKYNQGNPTKSSEKKKILQLGNTILGEKQSTFTT